MKKTDVVDLTIKGEPRMVGDVTKVSTGDVAKSGSDGAVGSVQAPMSLTAQGADGGVDNLRPSGDEYLPSIKDTTLGAPGIGSGLPQPDMGTAKSTDTLQMITGKKVGFPDSSDRASAGAKANGGQGLESTPTTGARQPFPPAANTTMQPKDVESFIGPK